MGTIRFDGVSKTYRGQREVHALDDVSLTVDEGEFVALLGPSGCGKSTLLNVLAGFEKVSSGKLLFDGATISSPGPDRGVVFQEAALFPWLMGFVSTQSGSLRVAMVVPMALALILLLLSILPGSAEPISVAE